MSAIDLVTPNIGMWFWTTFLFLALLIILRKTAWGPILKGLEEREQTIASDLKRAEQARVQAEKARDEVLAQQTKLMATANEQIGQMLQSASKRAKDIEEKAKQTAQIIQDQAKIDIELERQKAIASIRSEVVQMAVLAAKTIIAREVKAEDHKNIFNDTLSKLN